jgi:hypothetical protein
MTLDNAPEQLEIRRLARLVRVDPDELAGLGSLSAEDLRTLRGQVAAVLFDGDSDSWDKAVAVTGVVPAGLSAKLAQGALGPVMSARVTGRIDPAKAADVAAKLPPDFMADTAVNIDPRQTTDMIVALPPQTIADVGTVLADRGEWLVMADFVAAIGTDALRTTIDSLDEVAVLQIAVLLEDPERVDAVIGMLDDDRVAALRGAADAEGLHAHLDWVTDAAGPVQSGRLRA